MKPIKCRECGKLTTASYRTKRGTGIPCCLKCIRKLGKEIFWIMREG